MISEEKNKTGGSSVAKTLVGDKMKCVALKNAKQKAARGANSPLNHVFYHFQSGFSDKCSQAERKQGVGIDEYIHLYSQVPGEGKMSRMCFLNVCNMNMCGCKSDS